MIMMRFVVNDEIVVVVDDENGPLYEDVHVHIVVELKFED
jgi:hypothetical protein